MDWALVELELSNFRGVEGLSPLTMDTLYGSVWGLNLEYDIPFAKAMAQAPDRVVAYSLTRVRNLLQSPDIPCAARTVPRCGMGLGTFGWKYDPAIIKAAAEGGVVVIDTAEGYGYGRVETRLGEALKLCGPVEVTTKMRRDHMSPLALENAVQRSRVKLGIVPHMQIHYPHHEHPDALLRLAVLRRRGHIKSIGMGNCSVDQVEAAQRFLTDFSGDVIRSVQVRYNLMDRRIEGALLPYCQERGIVVMAYSPLGQRFRDMIKPELERVAARHDCSLTQVALAWLLEHPGVLPIPRTNKVAHLHDNLAAVHLRLTPKDMEELDSGYPR